MTTKILSKENLHPSTIKLKDAYNIRPCSPFYLKTFGLWLCLDECYKQGLPKDTDLNKYFMLDENGYHALWQLGWAEATF